MKKIVILVLSLFSSLLNANVSPPQYIELQGNFYQMGQQYAEALNDKLPLQLQRAKQYLYPEDPRQKQQFLVAAQQFVELSKQRYPAEIYKFIRGEADSHYAKTHGLHFDDFVFLDQQLFLSVISRSIQQPETTPEACSLVAANQQGVTVGRNFDYPRHYLKMMTDQPVLLSMEHSNKIFFPNKVGMITMPGVITQSTYANSAGLYMSLNLSSSAGLNFLVFKRRPYLNQMLLTMLKETSFQGLTQWAETTAPEASFILNIAGPGEHDMASVELTSFDKSQGDYSADTIPEELFGHKTRRPRSKNVIEPALDQNSKFLVSTNSFRMLDWEPALGHENWQHSPSRSWVRYTNLTKLLKENPKRDIKTLMSYEMNTGTRPQGATENYCGTDPEFKTIPNSTLYTVVFDSRKKVLHARFQQSEKGMAGDCQSQWTDWLDIRLK